MTNEYKFRAGYRPADIDPNTVGSELERIRVATGRLEPTAVVDASRPPDAPLHGAFEWDDSVAAEAHRRQQARGLIRCVVIVRDDKPAPAFVSIRLEGQPRYYQSTDVVVQNVDEYEAALRDMGARVASMRRSYEQVAQLAERRDDAKERRKIAKLRRPVETLASAFQGAQA